jgi:hypothetical protein
MYIKAKGPHEYMYVYKSQKAPYLYIKAKRPHEYMYVYKSRKAPCSMRTLVFVFWDLYPWVPAPSNPPPPKWGSLESTRPGRGAF